MLLAYVNASDMDGAEKFFRRLKEDGLRPNVVVYGTLMKGYSKLDDVEKVMRVYERMRMQGVEPNQTIFTTIMDVHGKNSDFGNAVIWFNEMETRGYPPDKKAKNILLSLAKTPEEQEEANELVGNGAIQLEVKPNRMTSGSDVDSADLHEGVLTDTGHHHSSNGASTTSDLNGINGAGSSCFDDEVSDDDDYEEEDDEDLNFVSFKDKRELNFAT
jgi:pentatricopeptide repeat protein